MPLADKSKVLHTPATRPLAVEAHFCPHPCVADVPVVVVSCLCAMAAVCGLAAARRPAAAQVVPAAAAVVVLTWPAVAVKVLLQPSQLSYACVLAHIMHLLLTCYATACETLWPDRCNQPTVLEIRTAQYRWPSQ